MNLSQLNPAIVYVNLDHREDRREATEGALKRLSLPGVRQPGVPADRVNDTRRFQNTRRYATSLAKRLAIRRGLKQNRDAVLLLEDDVVFHPAFSQLLGAIDLPDDWDLFYLGCRHMSPPKVVGPGIVRCAYALDNHALLIRSGVCSNVMRGLSGYGRKSARSILYCDQKLAENYGAMRVYAAFPNLAWQAAGYSDNSRVQLTHYRPDGSQAKQLAMMKAVESEMAQYLHLESRKRAILATDQETEQQLER